MSAMPVFPKRVTVRVNHPSPQGVAVILTIGMQVKNSFSYTVFLNADGIAEVSGAELLKSCDQERSTFIMDYVDPRVGFNGCVEARILDDSELRAAVDAFKMFSKHMPYPEGYEQKLVAAARRGQDPDGYKVQLTVD